MPRVVLPLAGGLLAVLAVIGLGVLGAAGGISSARLHTAVELTACRSPVDQDVLPAWARAGFSEPRPRIANVVGRKHEIVAILFAHLRSPPARRHANKILWVARRPSLSASPLRIRARRLHDGGPAGRVVSKTIPFGPGPSYVDVPSRGCWRMQLRWGNRSDELALAYD